MGSSALSMLPEVMGPQVSALLPQLTLPEDVIGPQVNALLPQLTVPEAAIEVAAKDPHERELVPAENHPLTHKAQRAHYCRGRRERTTRINVYAGIVVQLQGTCHGAACFQDIVV